MTEEVRFVHNEVDPEKGGIPRYGSHVKQIVSKEAVDFRDFKTSGNPFRKVWNNVYGRNLYARRSASSKSLVNHFFQPELYTSQLEGRDLVTIHDLFIMRDDQYSGVYGRGRKYFFTRRLEKAARNADFFIAVSEQTKKQCVERLGIDPSKIEVVNLGLREKFCINNTKDRGSIGYLGDDRGRKRVGKLVEDYGSSDLELKLELAGSVCSNYQPFASINVRGFVQEEELVNWYNGLSAFFLPSEVEGFGLPILEATACGTPVFVYEDASITEELEPYVFRVESVSEVEEKLRSISDRTLRKNSEAVKKTFTWKSTCEKHREVYRNLC